MGIAFIVDGSLGKQFAVCGLQFADRFLLFVVRLNPHGGSLFENSGLSAMMFT
jgi:hypothetical protein